MSRNPDGAPRSRGVNYFDVGVVGRRTGITMKANVKKDEDGLDNIDDFWADEDEVEDKDMGEDVNEDEEEQANSEHEDDQSGDRSYYEQDLPEELLATPTSRRSRAVPMTNSGSRRGLLSSSAFDHGAEEYQSPSFHAVKKRLVFTKEAPNAETRNNISDQSSSPALDRLLSVSKQKALLAKAAPSPGYLSKLAQTKGARPIPSYISKALGTNRPGINKAFNLGSDDNSVANGGSDNSDEEPASRPTPSRPIKATPQRRTAKSVKTPVEIRRKPKAPPPPSSSSPPPPLETYDDDHEYREEDRVSDDHNGFTFSDEENRRPSHKDSEDEEEDEEPLIDHRKTKAQSKTQVKETKSNDLSKASRANIPKKPAKVTTTTKKPAAAKPASRAKKISVSDRSGSSDSDGDDHSVPASRKTATQKGKTTSSAPKSGLIEIPVVPEAHEPDGTRKSSRTRLQPLEWWKNEKVVLGKSDVQGVAEIKAVIKAPAVEERVFGATKRKATKRPASKSTMNGHVAKKRVRGPDSDADDMHAEQVVDEEEEDRLAIEEQGLKEEPEQIVETIDWNTGETISRPVAEAKNAATFNKVQGGGYQYHRGLEDIKYIVSGKMRILPGGQKPVGNSAKTSMVFYVVSGAAQVCVNKTEFALSTGGSFLIPKGNLYSFTNLSSKRELILFFVQSRQQEGMAVLSSSASAASTPVPTASKGTTVEAAQAAAQAAAVAATAAKPKPKPKPKSKAATSTRTTRRSSASTAA